MRLYDEKEIGSILKRTAELSKSAERPVSDGLTLDELKQLAAEAGLDPNLVARAASELSVGTVSSLKPDIFGGPLAHSIEKEIDVQIDQDTWEEMLPIIRAHFKDPGIVQTRAGAFEWTGSGGDFSKKAHVSVQRANGGSRLHVFWSETSSAIPLFIPTILSFVLSLPILFEELAMGLIGIPVLIFVVASFFMLSRFGVQSMKKRHVRKLDLLTGELSQIALQSSLKDSAGRSRQPEDAVSDRPAAREGGPVLDSRSGKAEEPSLELPHDESDEQTSEIRDQPGRERS